MKKISIITVLLMFLALCWNVEAAKPTKGSTVDSTTTTNAGTTPSSPTTDTTVVWEGLLTPPNIVCLEGKPKDICTTFFENLASMQELQDQAMAELLATNSISDYETQYPVGTFDYRNCSRSWDSPCDLVTIDLANNSQVVLFAQHYGMTHEYTINSANLELIKNFRALILYPEYNEYAYIIYDYYYPDYTWLVRLLID